MAGLQHPAEAGGMMTAPNPMATMVALWLKQVEAWSAAMRTAIVLSVRDITVYFPFGQGFTQDIDPRTNWGWMSGDDVKKEYRRTRADV